MASSYSGALEISCSHFPILRGEGYEHWSHKMKTFFRSQGLWKTIEKGVVKEGPEDKMMESEKDDAKALFILQQAVDDTVLHRLVKFNTAKEAWDQNKMKMGNLKDDFSKATNFVTKIGVDANEGKRINSELCNTSLGNSESD